MTGKLRTIYFMRQIGTKGPVKIGCSSYVPGRLESLSVWSPVPLEVAATFPGNYSDEIRLHNKFWAQHSHHEWFDWSPELEAVIDAINDGSFDIESIPRGKRARKPWTELQRRTASYVQRNWRMKDRSGCRFPGNVYRAAEGDAAEAEAFRRYCADPITHGEPVDAAWAAAARAQWLALQSTSDARAA